MNRFIDVYVNDKAGRRVVGAEVIRENSTTVIVKLDDGNVIKRKKGRDIVSDE